jgi:anti-sigma factor RsiW
MSNRIPWTRAWRVQRERELCIEAIVHIDEIVDGELPASRKARLLEQHLTGCNSCLREAEVVRALKRAIVRVAAEADAEVVARLEVLARGLCSGNLQPPPDA